VGETQRERRRVVLPGEEVLGQPVEGALAAGRALAQRRKTLGFKALAIAKDSVASTG